MQPQAGSMRFDVLWPLGRRAVATHAAARRLPDLAGKTVGELWDSKFRGEAIFPMLRELLRARYPGIRFIEYSEFGNFYLPKEKDILGRAVEKLRARGADAVISGIGA